jgi:hypothetical protein
MQKASPNITAAQVYEWVEPDADPTTIIALPGRILFLSPNYDSPIFSHYGSVINCPDTARSHLARLRANVWYIDALTQAINVAWPPNGEHA